MRALRTADELIARAEADSRGVAVLPLSETARDISLQIAGAARVADQADQAEAACASIAPRRCR